MKIVDVSGFYSEFGGGVRSYVHQKFEAAARHGHDLTIIAPGVAHRVESRDGGKIVWVASPPMPFDDNYRLFLGAREVERAIDAECPDVIEGSSTWRGGWIAARSQNSCVKSLVFHQDFVAAYAYTMLDRFLPRSVIDRVFSPYWSYVARLSSHFDITVAGGEWLAKRLSAFGVKNPLAVPLGVESGRFSPENRDVQLRRDLLSRCGISDDGILLLAVGRFHPEKRHEVIVDGFIHAKRKLPNLGLVIVGDGLTRKSVERAARRAGNVCLFGAVSDREEMARIYASADLLVHGSGAETYGMVVAEAIISGLPVIVPDSGGASDFASRSHSAVYATGDGRACGLAVENMLSSAVFKNSRPRNFDYQRISSAEAHFDKLFEIYQALVVERR